MRRLGLAIILAGCGSPATPLVHGEPPSEWVEPSSPAIQQALAERAPVQRFRAVHAGSWELDLDPVLGTPRAIRGAGIAFDTSNVDAAARSFVREHADLFGTDELIVDGTVIDPALTSVALTQRYRGIPVIAGHLGLTISHGRLVLVQGTTYPIHDLDTTTPIEETRAIAAAHAVIDPPQRGDRDTARLVILPERAPGSVSYRLAWEVTAWREDRQTIVNVDARTARVVGGYDANRNDYPGRATNLVDERTVGDEVVPLPAAYLRLHSMRGATVTDGEGAFAFSGTAGPLMVTANLHGAYVDVHNVGGPDAQFVGMMRPESPYALDWTEARSTPQERDVFRGVNTTNRFVATVYPELPWIHEPLLANVDLPQRCNAYWNGASINFFVAGSGCNNTGRIFDVVAHEWGHGLDQNVPGGAIDGALGEFIGDLISCAQTHSPLIGPGFFTNGGPVRDLKDPAFRCFDPKKRGVHAQGQLLGAVVWDILNDLEAAGVTGEPLKRLLLRPIAIAQTRSEWYGAMLAVDDDDGDLANGTPHECLIYNQFKAHSCGDTRWPGIPDRDPPHCMTSR